MSVLQEMIPFYRLACWRSHPFQSLGGQTGRSDNVRDDVCFSPVRHAFYHFFHWPRHASRQLSWVTDSATEALRKTVRKDPPPWLVCAHPWRDAVPTFRSPFQLYSNTKYVSLKEKKTCGDTIFCIEYNKKGKAEGVYRLVKASSFLSTHE